MAGVKLSLKDDPTVTVPDDQVIAGSGTGEIVGSDEQEAIWHELLTGSRPVIVSATAGSGKTRTIVEYVKREKNAKVGLVAFNKHIATELQQRMGGQANVKCLTYHSLGYQACLKAFRRCEVDQHKVYGILDSLHNTGDRGRDAFVKGRTKALVGLAKQYGFETPELLRGIADEHALDIGSDEPTEEMIVELAVKVLARSAAETRTVDFDDQVWLPFKLGLELPKFDTLCVDEYQDTGLVQQHLALRAAHRLVAVGDPNQAIYRFRGADSRSFDRLRDKLPDAITLPLTLTRRCPIKHVELAQRIVPQIRAMENAPFGRVVRLELDKALASMMPVDLVLCRTNAPLLKTAYGLIQRGVKAIVRGRDIGRGLTELLDKATRKSSTKTFNDVMGVAYDMTLQLRDRYAQMPQGRGESRIAAVMDKWDCLNTVAGQCSSVEEVRRAIDGIFGEFDSDGKPKDAVVLGTVHRTKGLESNRVFVLRGELIPHPMAKEEEDVVQELNCAYIAVTRAKFDLAAGKAGELFWAGPVPKLFM